MRPNLDSLKAEIEAHLETEGFAVFHGFSRMMDSLPLVYWDTEHHPDYKNFVQVAQASGARLMVVHQREFSADYIEDALERLEAIEMPRDEYRKTERQLNDMRVYEGFTCAIELSFDYQGRIYLFDLHTDWYEELTDLLSDLEALGGAPEEDDDPEGTMGGYFSKN